MTNLARGVSDALTSWDKGMSAEQGQLRYASLLTFLVFCAVLLSARIGYLFFSDAQRFPISTIKVVANYQHVSRRQLEAILAKYANSSYFSLPVEKLQHELAKLEWADKVQIEKIWPDTLKITLTEHTPVALWNHLLMAADGRVFHAADPNDLEALPTLIGPQHQQADVLQIYQKLSKLLASCGLRATSLELRDNQAWELSIANGIQLRLGKRDLEQRVQRFCAAYPSVFADKLDQLASVDLRYARGMAVQWKQQTGR